MVVGRLLSYWEGNFSGAFTVKLRVLLYIVLLRFCCLLESRNKKNTLFPPVEVLNSVQPVEDLKSMLQEAPGKIDFPAGNAPCREYLPTFPLECGHFSPNVGK